MFKRLHGVPRIKMNEQFFSRSAKNVKSIRWQDNDTKINFKTEKKLFAKSTAMAEFISHLNALRTFVVQ